MPVEEQVVSIFAGTKGCLDDLPVEPTSAASRPSCSRTSAAATRRLLDEIREHRHAARGRQLDAAVAGFKERSSHVRPTGDDRDVARRRRSAE